MRVYWGRRARYVRGDVCSRDKGWRMTLKSLGHKCHGQRALLSFDSIGRIHRKWSDRGRKSNRFRSGTRTMSITELSCPASALPYSLGATLPRGKHPPLVVVTEYPDPLITDTLKGNAILRFKKKRTPRRVRSRGLISVRSNMRNMNVDPMSRIFC